MLSTTECIKKNGVHLFCLIISKLLKLIAYLNYVLFSFEQAVIRIFTPCNVYAMTNLVKAIDLRCPPIMQINYAFHSRHFRLLHKAATTRSIFAAILHAISSFER